MVSGQWRRGNLLLFLPRRCALRPGCTRLRWINFPDLWELKQWKMEDIEQVDWLNLTFTQHMKDNGVAHFHTMACLSCLQPAAFIQHSHMWLLVNAENKKYTVCTVNIKWSYSQNDSSFKTDDYYLIFASTISNQQTVQHYKHPCCITCVDNCLHYINVLFNRFQTLTWTVLYCRYSSLMSQHDSLMSLIPVSG